MNNIPDLCAADAIGDDDIFQCCCFVVGDIGKSGLGRQLVSQAMSQLQNLWKQQGLCAASFILTTGDNMYTTAAETEGYFTELVTEVLDVAPPLPWFVCLGNHDVKPAIYALTRSHHETDGMGASTEGDVGAVGGSWKWLCPGPSFALDDVVPGITQGLAEILVINTNKLKSSGSDWGAWLFGGQPPDASSPPNGGGLSSSRDRGWWKEQKQSVSSRLQSATNVKSHHQSLLPGCYYRYQ